MLKYITIALITIGLSGVLFVYEADAKKRKRRRKPKPVQTTPAPAPAKTIAPSSGGPKPLEIRGQTRTLSMMLVLQNKRDKIDFIKPRKNYRPEILATEY